MTLERPADLFDRVGEWDDLVQLTESPGRLGVVWGPRRAGKSTLLAALAEVSGGLYYEAVRQDGALSRAELGALIGARRGLPPIRFDTWEQVISALLEPANGRLTVLDEFGYLCEASPELPSIIQRVVDRTRRSAKPSGQVILCGSAVAQLSHLLDRNQPLFGRAQLALVVDAFDFRVAAAYWGIDDPALAVKVGAVLGGLPGYLDIVGGPPADAAGFDGWIAARVLSAASPLIEEDNLVLAASGLDANVYRSIVAAVAGGDHTPTPIASRIGRNASSLARPLENLVQAGLLRRIVDPLRQRRSRYELADPFLAFHHAIVRPHRTRLRRRQQAAVWEECQETWRARVLGPYFERLAREATIQHPGDFGFPRLGVVGATTVADQAARTSLEVDVAALDGDGRVAVIGEAKHTAARRSRRDLARLERIRALLAPEQVEGAKLALFSATGFEPDLVSQAAARTDVELIDLARLYGTGAEPGAQG